MTDRAPRRLRVLLVDDQPLVRAGMRHILRESLGFEIAGEADDGATALAAVDRVAPDVVLMDIRMRGMDGAEATRRLRGRDEAPPVLVLTTFDDDDVLAAALHAGAAGFILKDAPGDDLVRAVRTVADGGAWLDPAVTARVLEGWRAQALRPAATGEVAERAARLHELTGREIDVLRLMARGATNAEIATQLSISEATVKTHIGHLFTKLDVRDRAAAIVFAFDHGVVAPGSTAPQQGKR